MYSMLNAETTNLIFEEIEDILKNEFTSFVRNQMFCNKLKNRKLKLALHILYSVLKKLRNYIYLNMKLYK